jgi:hypothetical protein
MVLSIIIAENETKFQEKMGREPVKQCNSTKSIWILLTKSKSFKGFESFSMSRLTSLYYNLIKKKHPKDAQEKIITNQIFLSLNYEGALNSPKGATVMPIKALWSNPALLQERG